MGWRFIRSRAVHGYMAIVEQEEGDIPYRHLGVYRVQAWKVDTKELILDKDFVEPGNADDCFLATCEWIRDTSNAPYPALGHYRHEDDEMPAPPLPEPEPAAPTIAETDKHHPNFGLFN